jgi:hypothetical protein
MMASRFSDLEQVTTDDPSHSSSILATMSVGGGQTYTIDTVPDHVRNLNITKARLDAFTLGPELPAEEDSTASEQSINHWAWSFVAGNDKSVRFSMESRLNVAVNKYGVLRIKAVSYEGKARSVVKSWEFRTATITIGHIVDLIKLYGLEKFEMVPVDGGKFKGCRHWS